MDIKFGTSGISGRLSYTARLLFLKDSFVFKYYFKSIASDKEHIFSKLQAEYKLLDTLNMGVCMYVSVNTCM